MSRDLICVHKAADIGAADIVVAWLDEQGIEAMVKDRYSAGTLHVPQIVAPAGIEVCVLNPEDAPRARALLEAQLPSLERASKVPDHVMIEAVCEECGGKSRSPGSQAGKVQDCPFCGEYMDVPEQPTS